MHLDEMYVHIYMYIQTKCINWCEIIISKNIVTGSILDENNFHPISEWDISEIF
jgi:hypothetical protein